MNLRNRRRSTSSLLVAGAVTLVVGLSGCSGNPSSGGSGGGVTDTATGPGKSASLVPKTYHDKGELTIALDATTPPGEYIAPDGTTIVGYQADLIKAVAQKLNLKPKLVSAGYDAIIPGLVDKRFDIGQAGMYATPERIKKLDFVSYALIGSTFVASGSSNKKYAGLASLCGVKTAVQIGTSLQTMLQDQSKKCTAAGKPKVNILTYNSGSDEVLAVSSGRADVAFDSQETLSYLVSHSNGKYKLAGPIIAGKTPSSIAVLKGTGMDKAVQAALREIIADGTYSKIFNKWGVAPNMIKTPKINDVGVE